MYRSGVVRFDMERYLMIENHVTSLELSRKLHELGIRKPSYFKWELRESGDTEIFHSKPTSCAHKYYHAYLASELGDILPYSLLVNNEEQVLFYNFKEKELLYLGKHEYTIKLVQEYMMIPGESECNHRAKMIIHLIENGYVKVEDLNV